ncbi:MAG: hypothetical protein WAW80_03280 [Candidatus Saccharimonadales bacterium]
MNSKETSSINIPDAVTTYVSLGRRFQTDDLAALSDMCEQNLSDIEIQATLIEGKDNDDSRNDHEYIELGLYPAQPNNQAERLLYTNINYYIFALARRALKSPEWELLPASASSHQQLSGNELTQTNFADSIARRINYISSEHQGYSKVEYRFKIERS